MKHIFENTIIAASAVLLGAAVFTGAYRMGWQGVALTVAGAAGVDAIWSAWKVKKDSQKDSQKKDVRLSLELNRDGFAALAIEGKGGKDSIASACTGITLIVKAINVMTGKNMTEKIFDSVRCVLEAEKNGKIPPIEAVEDD